jgi:hypothetical protein
MYQQLLIKSSATVLLHTVKEHSFGQIREYDGAKADVVNCSILELKSLLKSGFDSTFGKFLELYGDVNEMHFYQSVQRLEVFNLANTQLLRISQLVSVLAGAEWNRAEVRERTNISQVYIENSAGHGKSFYL